MLDRYAQTEQGRPAADRYKNPSLTEVTSVVDGLKTNINIRQTGKSQRTTATKQTLEVAARLLDLLQGAAVQIVLKRFNGKVTPELGEWGFDVTARAKTAKKPAKPTA